MHHTYEISSHIEKGNGAGFHIDGLRDWDWYSDTTAGDTDLVLSRPTVLQSSDDMVAMILSELYDGLNIGRFPDLKDGDVFVLHTTVRFEKWQRLQGCPSQVDIPRTTFRVVDGIHVCLADNKTYQLLEA